MSSYTITTLCLVLWYMCVLVTWMHVNQTLKLFSHFPQSWLWIVLSFAGSLAANFIFNPLMWIMVGCYIHQARKLERTSKWQFYPPMIGVLILACALASVFTNMKVPTQLLSLAQPGSQSNFHPAVSRPKLRTPEVSGIMFSDDDPKVLINGNVLHQGDEVDGFVIDDIKEGSVTFLAPDGSSVTRRVK
ncbi:MAG: hypothetical protein JNN05_01450 [Candidatus Omnitrophica bacterium]|nr:hypothetical protein [Candidatus Omnitrophota bacterium]